MMGRTDAVCAKCQCPISAAQVSGTWVDRRGIATCPRGGWHEPGGSQLTRELQADVFGPASLLVAAGNRRRDRNVGGAAPKWQECRACHRPITWDPHLRAWVDRLGSSECRTPGRVHVPIGGH